MTHCVQKSIYESPLNSNLVTNCFLLLIIHSILYYWAKDIYKGNQLLHVSKAVWVGFKHNWESMIFWVALKQI